jgi:DNA polymerase-3 subunit alpha
VIDERRENGKFKDVFDMAARCSQKVINKKQIEGLSAAGAFDAMHKNRAQIYESCEILCKYNASMQGEKDTNQISLFGDVVELSKPSLLIVKEWDSNERLSHEYDAFGFYLSDHPLNDYQQILDDIGVIPSLKLEERINSASMKIKVAGVVATKTLRSGKKGRFGFAKLSDAYGVYEIVIYDDDLLTRSAHLLDSNIPLLIHAEARKDEGGVRIIADKIEELATAISQTYKKHIKSNDMNLTVKKPEAVKDLRNVLELHKYQDGMLSKNKINLVVNDNDKQITLELPGYYAVSEDVKEKIDSVLVG